MKMNKNIWIAWERHRRTVELSNYLNLELYILDSKLNRLIKYPIFLVKTIKILASVCPRVLFVQNPSIVLAFVAIVLKPILKYTLIIDAHNVGLLPENKFLKKIPKLYILTQANTDITIVTNKELSKTVKKNGGNPFILKDRIPQINCSHKLDLKGKSSVLFICTFGKDEPYNEVFEAANYLCKDISIYVTGNYHKKIDSFKKFPENIVFTGYLPEHDYFCMLHSVNIILDLTYRDHCLVCGAYESVAVGAPIVLSDTDALKSYFYKGTVFTKNDSKSIAVAIQNALRNEHGLRSEIAELRSELIDDWGKRVKILMEMIFDKPHYS